MPESNTPSDGENADADESVYTTTSTCRERRATHSRRRLLQTLAVGGSLWLAGCGQTGSDTPTDTPGTGATPTTTQSPDRLPHVSGQTLRIPTGNDPVKTTFYGRHTLNRLLSGAYATRVLENASFSLQRLVWEAGVWPDGLFAGTGEVHYNWIEEPIEITPTEVTITIGDDARWSDGHPITGKDVAAIEIQQSIRKNFPPYYAEEGADEPGNIWAAFDGFDVTDRSVTYTSSAGHFEDFWDIHIKNQLATYLGPHHIPTHVEPYATYADAVVETATRAQAGEINPWKGYNDPWTDPDDPHKESLVEEHLNETKYVEKFSKPENVLATGAWDLVALDGKDFVFEPNQYHRRAEQINFETLRCEFTPSGERQRAALKADRLDFGSAAFGPPTPQAVVESFPNHIRELLVPGNQYTGNELALNFDHPALDDRAVRAALMYALDHEAIATNIHQSATPPVVTPGGDCWDATEWASQEWLDENLVTYETDRERAATLMREAGFTKRSGQWVDADGESFTLALGTPRDTPRWEPTVASQLSEFGIQTSVRTLGDTAFSNRVDNGEFPLWPSSLNSATNLAPYTLFVWLDAATSRQKYGLYPEEQFETGHFSRGGTPLPRTEERYRVFTVEAPPIGEPDGPLEEYHPAALSLFFQTNPPEGEFRRRVKTGIWLANWYLPTIPLTKRLEQFFVDDAHWLWPTDTPWWVSFTNGSAVLSGSLFARGTIQANPENPEDGASVGEE